VSSNIFTVIFTDGSEVFITADNEAHARRIIEHNGLWRRSTEDVPFERQIRNVIKLDTAATR